MLSRPNRKLTAVVAKVLILLSLVSLSIAAFAEMADKEKDFSPKAFSLSQNPFSPATFVDVIEQKKEEEKLEKLTRKRAEEQKKEQSTQRSSEALSKAAREGRGFSVAPASIQWSNRIQYTYMIAPRFENEI